MTVSKKRKQQLLLYLENIRNIKFSKGSLAKCFRRNHISLCCLQKSMTNKSETQVNLKKKFNRVEDLAYASRNVNCDFLFTPAESGWQNQRSFKDYIQRIDEELKDVAHPVLICLDNY